MGGVDDVLSLANRGMRPAALILHTICWIPPHFERSKIQRVNASWLMLRVEGSNSSGEIVT